MEKSPTNPATVAAKGAVKNDCFDHPRQPHLCGRPTRHGRQQHLLSPTTGGIQQHSQRSTLRTGSARCPGGAALVCRAASHDGGASSRKGGRHPVQQQLPAEFLLKNLKIQTQVIETAWRTGVRRLLLVGSSCIYPKFARQPIREEALLSSQLEPTSK